MSFSRLSYFCALSTFTASILLVTSCDSPRVTSPEAKVAFERVIPKPNATTSTGKTFLITESTTIVAASELQDVAKYLAQNLQHITGISPTLTTNVTKGAIVLSLEGGSADLGSEGYTLQIDEDQLKIVANKPAGIFYGIQTVRQIIADKNDKSSRDEWEVATGTITDHPEYPWRGSMLDVARHFFSVADVKRYIDLLSFYKINILHLHLSDDQGWRIEIKSWPNLTAIGGQSQVGGGKGGFYTQEQYKEIVAYAQSRFITIVPEIDLPGHINAALVSYPGELLPGPSIVLEATKPRPVAGRPHIGTEVGFSTLSIKKELTFKFVEDVIREIASITPGPYFHVGGDEAAVTKKADYITFINRFKEIVNANGKIMIGWEEIAQADLDSTSIAQFWHSQDHANTAAEKGAKIIFSPSTKAYLDMQYDSTSRIGLHWAAYIEVDSSYMWDPTTLVSEIERKQIMGVEAPLWTETVVTMDDIEYLVFPRLPGIAEIGWTSSAVRNWEDYKVRLANHAVLWRKMEIDFYRSPKVSWADSTRTK
ncbi:beta-N-acetylhexosaminidase [Pseudochryseolinea flava]|uniref:beta-N-acetylhexosaminidase n=1 Tax=Pseudochryseolinea flava TaxID=2059302 RepID=A0A364Y5I6_9BACT|nr:beta-N-acetylhexosaminidase [Pseudochryseolinea flava]RAW01077.1 beta-N-acetylhexosaminidase [Pseudochryseolinea flava]